jgi:hypothetical protein
MKKRSNENIDGFVLKRRGAKDPERPRGPSADNLSVPERFLDRFGKKPDDDPQPSGIGPAEEAVIRDAANALSEDEQEPKRAIFKRLFKRGKKEEGLDRGQLTAKYKRKRLIKKILIILGSLLLLIGIILGIKAFLASQNIFDGNLFGLFSEKRLQTDQYGRTNILVFGTEEDSPYHQDAGGELTDSIMILSIHQDEKDAYMLSLPRDMWVKYERSCPSGFEGKINAAYMCGKSDNNDEKEGTKFLQKVVEQHFGDQRVVDVRPLFLERPLPAVLPLDLATTLDDIDLAIGIVVAHSRVVRRLAIAELVGTVEPGERLAATALSTSSCARHRKPAAAKTSFMDCSPTSVLSSIRMLAGKKRTIGYVGTRSRVPARRQTIPSRFSTRWHSRATALGSLK